MAFALSLALAKAGRSIAARMAMMAMTTSSSIKVKARRPGDARPVGLLRLFVFVIEMTRFKIYVLRQKRRWFPATQRNFLRPCHDWQNNRQRLWHMRMGWVLVKYIAHRSVFY
jgi:hypothetical protein